MPSTKVDLNYSRIARMEGLDELAKALFPGNKNHQRTFLAVFLKIKWTPGQFLPALEPIAEEHGISHRTLETVRAKMRRLGLIDHVSRFNQKHGYREGWVLSRRFGAGLERMAHLCERFHECRDRSQQQKDRDLEKYL
jgi:hypothetical protein